ncbi:MAG: extracellular solute-binding protein [Chloroflexota bacterium]
MSKVVKTIVMLGVAVMLLVPLATVAPQNDPVQLRVMWFNDARESITLQQQLDAFMEQNPGIEVELEQTGIEINEFLNCRIIGSGSPQYAELGCEQTSDEPLPDLARTNTPGAFREHLLDIRPYLDDPDAWAANFNEGFLDSLRSPENPDGLHGYPVDVTVSAPFVNRTLWEEAGVPIPSDSSAEVTWEEWTKAAAQVQAALSTQDREVFAIAMDRSGHRFWGPSLSLCATYVDPADPESDVLIDTAGFRNALQMFTVWHEQSLVPSEIWEGDGDTVVPADQFFIDNQIAFYFSGNWQLNKFDSKIETFQWEAVPNPVGPCGQTGMVGGTAMIAMEWTEYPEEVVRLIEFLTQQENMEAFARENLILSGHNAVNSMELDYNDNTGQLVVFQEEISRAVPEAFALQYRTDTTIIHSTIREMLVLYLQQNLPPDIIIDRMQEEIDRQRGVTRDEAPADAEAADGA